HAAPPRRGARPHRPARPARPAARRPGGAVGELARRRRGAVAPRVRPAARAREPPRHRGREGRAPAAGVGRRAGRQPQRRRGLRRVRAAQARRRRRRSRAQDRPRLRVHHRVTVRRLRRWWSARPLRLRITLVVGCVALLGMPGLSRLGVSMLYETMLGAADAELRSDARVVAEQLAAGTPPEQVRRFELRVVDMSGVPVDGGPALPLRPDQTRALAAGDAFVVGDFRELRRWLAVPAVMPDGSPRLVVVTSDLVGGAILLANATVGFVVGALVVAAVVALAAWAATRAALRPVDRMRVAASALPPGQRLPVPVAKDELRVLAEEFNALLARRDEAVSRLERFTGDAAHELRSPVAAIRAQAEVAVAHPDPELTDEVLRSIVAEATRLTALLSDLLALTRADAGQRPPAEPVDL